MQKIALALLAGIFLGLANLTRPILMFFPVFLVLFIFFYQKFKFGSLLKKSLIILVVFYIITAPWLIRNYLIFQEGQISDVGSLVFYNRAYRINYSDQEAKYFILSGLFGGYLTKKIDAGYDYNFSKFEPHAQRVDQLALAKGFDYNYPADVTASRKILFSEAKNVIFYHPFKYLGYSFLEFFRLHTPLINETGITNLFAGSHPEIPDFLKTLIIIFIRFTYLLFFVIILFSAIVSRKKFNLVLPLIILLLYLILLLCSLENIPRYSIPLYPFYFIFFAFGVFSIFKEIFKKEV